MTIAAASLPENELDRWWTRRRICGQRVGVSLSDPFQPVSALFADLCETLQGGQTMRRIVCVAEWLCCISVLTAAPTLHADALHDWNAQASEVVLAARMPAPQAARTAAFVQTATYEAVNAITGRYSGGAKLQVPAHASVDAAIAAVHRAVLSQLVPAQQAAIDHAYKAALASIADGPRKADGIAVGEAAAATVLAARGDDRADAVECYRPHTSPGVYVPTALPVLPQWPKRKPWAMRDAQHFRPGPPPSLSSTLWANDFQESKALGARNSSERIAEQTDIAHFWETTAPSLYFQVVRSVTDSPERDVTRNARLLALAAQAIDDALIAVFDGKYAYNFWRPVTAIRNGDLDGNAATERAVSWLPLIDTPMHPEYPCAHCTVAAAIGAVLEAELGSQSSLVLHASSPTLPGVVRSWSNLADFVSEVANARVWAGVHYRNSTTVGATLGRKIGFNVAKNALRSVE
jgi:hypothetical protein